MNRTTARELSVFTLLLILGVLGRWAQPAWNFTPLAAITMLGGYYFRSLLPAVLLPVSILAISDLVLMPHDSLMVQAMVHLAMLVPLALGLRLQKQVSRQPLGGPQLGKRTVLALAYGLVPATIFFVVTNFAVWALHSYYPHTLAGLAECYAAGVPFFRTMLAGDVLYTGVLFGSLAWAESAKWSKAAANAA